MASVQKLRYQYILEAVGLERRGSMPTSFAKAWGLFAMGMAAGVGLGLLLAPRPGWQIRDDLGRRIKRSAGRAANRAHDWLESNQMAAARNSCVQMGIWWCA